MPGLCLTEEPPCQHHLGTRQERSEVTEAHTRRTSASLGDSTLGGFADQTLRAQRADLLEQMIPTTEQFGNKGLAAPKRKCMMGEITNTGQPYIKEALGTCHMWVSTAMVTLRGLPSDLVPGCLLPLQAAGSTTWLLTGTSSPSVCLTLSFWVFEGGSTFCYQRPEWSYFLHDTPMCCEFSELGASLPVLGVQGRLLPLTSYCPFLSFFHSLSVFYELAFIVIHGIFYSLHSFHPFSVDSFS